MYLVIFNNMFATILFMSSNGFPLPLAFPLDALSFIPVPGFAAKGPLLE